MGQYSQWQHYCAIDQQLQAERARLEQELRHLQEEAHQLEVYDFHAPNSIIQALQHHLYAESSSTALSSHTSSMPLVTAPARPERGTPLTITPVYPRPQWPPSSDMLDPSRYTALRAAQLAPATARSSRALQRAGNRHLVPTQHIAPQEALSYTGHTRPTQRTLPTDPQDEHTDQMVQRWLERWDKDQPDQQNT
ncbi:MAG TPA: hypothetical protein VKX46_05270 [Ktedonobacteraceae bacterium]|nr:hypothetical protein [Ktedonobacteraceae bacterium]